MIISVAKIVFAFLLREEWTEGGAAAPRKYWMDRTSSSRIEIEWKNGYGTGGRPLPGHIRG
jgi:hypothetical protein